MTSTNLIKRILYGTTGIVLLFFIVLYLTKPAFYLMCEEVTHPLVGPRTFLLGIAMLCTILITPLFSLAFKKPISFIISIAMICWIIILIYLGINN